MILLIIGVTLFVISVIGLPIGLAWITLHFEKTQKRGDTLKQ